MRLLTRLRWVPWAAALSCGVFLGCAPAPAAAPLGGVDPAAAPTASAHPTRTKAANGSRSSASEPNADASSDTASKVDGLAPPSAEAAATPSDGVTFKETVAQVGDFMTMRLRIVMNGSMGMPIEGMDELAVDLTGEHETRTEVLEVEEGEAVKYRVEYVKDRKRGTMMGQAHDETSPLEGNTYVVDESGGGFQAKRADGRKLSSEEEAELKSNHTNEDGEEENSDDFDFIPDRPIQLGETLPIPEKALKSLGENAEVLSNISLRFDGLRIHEGVEVGVFSLLGNIDADVSMGHVRAKPRGQLWIAVDGEYPTHMDITANVDADVGDEDMRMKGSGTLLLGGAMKYEPVGRR